MDHVEISAKDAGASFPGLATLAPGSRLWVFPLRASLSKSDPRCAELSSRLSSFLAGWEAHGAAVSGALEVAYGRFVLVGADKQSAAVSGCSIDSLFGAVRQELSAGGNEMADLSDIFFLRGAEVEQMNRADFASYVKSDEFSPDITVFDTTVDTTDRLGDFARPFSESWHARLFPRA